MTNVPQYDDKTPGDGQFFRFVVDNAVDGFFIVDTARRFVEANAALCRMFGLKRAEIIGRSPFDVIAPESHPELIRQMQMIETTERRQYRVSGRRKDGSTFPMFLNNTSFRDASGAIAGAFGFVTDLTSLVEAQQAVAASERELQRILDHMQDTYYRTDASGIIMRVSRSAEKLLGFSPEEMMGRPLADFYFDPLDRDDFVARMDASNGALTGYESRLRHKDGQEVWVLTNAQYLRDADGSVVGVEGTTRDNIEHRRMVEALRYSEGRLIGLIEALPDAVFLKDGQGHWQVVNNAGLKLFRLVGEDWLGKDSQQIAAMRPDLAPEMRACGQSDHLAWQARCLTRDEETIIDQDGQARHWEFIKLPLFYADGGRRGLVVVARDLTERRASEARIEFLAHHDPLTDLPNRLLLRDRLERSIALGERTATRVALLFIDLDRFKTVNDSLGHPVGDRLLREAAQRLRACVRETDTVSRQGGDEFLIVLSDLKESDAATQVAEEILVAMSIPFSLDGHDVAISCSVGVAVFPEDGRDFDELLKKSDIAMYHAKEAGRNAFRYYTERMNIDALERLDLQNRLRRGLERNEFALHYQPVVELTTGRIVGAEALVRWNSPESGLVMPGRFISVAEESGLIVPLGDWVLREACRELRAWHDAGNDHLYLAVNLSAIQFRRGSVEESVIRALRDSGANPGSLELELTESILLQGAEHVLATVRQLKGLGVRLSIDDFGTGYSSLAYLKRFAVDKLKIDQSFVRDLPHDADNAAIVGAIIQMAKSLNLRVLAEGVENDLAVAHLRTLQCDYVQGYHFGRPVAADEFRALIV